MNVKTVSKIVPVAIAVLAIAGTAFATNSWNGFHWARTSNPFTLKVGDNVSSVWDTTLRTAASDWSVSPVLDMSVVSGQARGNCQPTRGRVEVCNKTYGQNGWLGIAQVWVSGTHITQGTVKLNDTYFNTATYNTPAWRNMVTCQEVGHTIGLDHQDEVFTNTNLGTCMDYTSDPTGTLGTNGTLNNEHPNQHDYDELAIIYAHLDSTNTVLSTAGTSKPSAVGQDIDLNNPSAWGKAVRQDARNNNSVFVRDLGNGEKLVTFVISTE